MDSFCLFCQKTFKYIKSLNHQNKKVWSKSKSYLIISIFSAFVQFTFTSHFVGVSSLSIVIQKLQFSTTRDRKSSTLTLGISHITITLLRFNSIPVSYNPKPGFCNSVQFDDKMEQSFRLKKIVFFPSFMHIKMMYFCKRLCE